MCMQLQGMRDLHAVAEVQDIELAASAAMITAHEAAKVQDIEAIMMLQGKLDVSAQTFPAWACIVHALHWESAVPRRRGHKQADGERGQRCVFGP